MPDRREFLLQAAVAGAGGTILGPGGSPPASAAEKDSRFASAARGRVLAAKPLRILVLGGTGFIGSHFLPLALDRGHTISVFSRGKRSGELSSGVEPLIGDRNGNLESIKNRDWDAVVDIATYGPLWVRTLGEALKERVKHYTFISSVAVYEDRKVSDNIADEQSTLMEYARDADPYSITQIKDMYEYRTLKVLCEREAERQFPGKTLIVRPGVISGPGDNVGGLTYLTARMQAGGEMLVAGDPLTQVQLIDVRDMSEWMLRLIESAQTGAFNAAGPALPLGWAEMLGALRGSSSVSVKLTWVPIPWVEEQKVESPAGLLYWPTGVGIPGLMRMSNAKARAQGLTFRSLSATSADTLAWFRRQPASRHPPLLLGSSLEDSMQRERELLAAWHARNTG